MSWQQILSNYWSENHFFSPSVLKDIFSGIELYVGLFFFQLLKDVISLSSGLYKVC